MSSSFQEFAHLQIPLEDITSATNSFADENLIGKGEYGNVYKGQLLRSGQLINITAWRLYHDSLMRYGGVEFWTEISMLSRLNHKNMVSIVGFCDENGEKIIIVEHAVHGSLYNHLSSPALTWMQRLHICVGAARALSYIHYDTGRNYGVIHRDIKSSNILLDENWEAKVCGFGFSISYLANRRRRLVLSLAVGTIGYVDPIYMETSSVTHKSDVYSFGVVMFEVLCRREAVIREDGGHQFLDRMAGEHYEEGKLDEIIHPDLRKQMDPQSSIIFSDTAYRCLNRQRAQRPDMENVVKSLERALEFHWRLENPEPSRTPVEDTSSNYLKENKDNLKISFEDIKLATQNFSDKKVIGKGSFGNVYKGEVPHANGENIIAVKRLDRSFEVEFLNELEILFEYQHENVIGLVGYCDEVGEKIIVYEYASRGSLDRNLKDDCLTWMKRLEICIDVATGLDFFHGTTDVKQEVVLHRDIKSPNILLNVDWKAKISDFGLSLVCPMNPEMDYVIDNTVGTPGYCDPLYIELGFLTKESDIYSLGVVLFEILCGTLVFENYEDRDHHLVTLVTNSMNEGRLEEMVFEGIKEQIVLESLTTYLFYHCVSMLT